MIQRKIKVKLDAINGLHFAFGKEAEGIKKEIDAHKLEEEAEFVIGSTTQFLYIDLYCQDKGIQLEVYNEDGQKFKTPVEAHAYINKEYIELDILGLDSLEEGEQK